MTTVTHSLLSVRPASMWSVFEAQGPVPEEPRHTTHRMPTAGPYNPSNTTFSGNKASQFTVEESLGICQQLFEHSSKAYSNEHYNLIWRDSLTTALEGCKGLLKLSIDKALQDSSQECMIYFILFLTFLGVATVAVSALLYLIAKMRRFISLRKCMLSSIESRETRPSPPTMLPAINTRPLLPAGTSWAGNPAKVQNLTTSQPPPSTPSNGYPVQTQPRHPEPQQSPAIGTITGISPEERQEILEQKFLDYQRSLWELSAAGQGRPPAIYPQLEMSDGTTGGGRGRTAS